MTTTLLALIAAQPDVRAVLELEPVAGTAGWRYLVETPFTTWPRYVIGRTDATLADVHITLRCGHIDTARAAWSAVPLESKQNTPP